MMVFNILPLLLFAFAANGSTNYQQGTLQEFMLGEAILNALVNHPSLVIQDDRTFLSSILNPVIIPEREVGFLLFTKVNPDMPYIMKLNNSENLQGSSFNATRPTKIIIHGWTDSSQTYWLQDMRKNYLNVGDYNVICINWFPGSATEYLTAAKITRQVGGYLAEFLDFLRMKGNLALNDVHILGHSLGAHVAGFAGTYLSGKIGRITGMDPARPWFETSRLKNLKNRLDASDAKFVDVIHTCAGTIGFAKSIGHADFFPNGGTIRQPGCPIFMRQYCSHGRSHQFMTESILNSEAFIAVFCKSWKDFTSGKCSSKTQTTFMGEKVSHDTRGIYFLKTNSESPFGRGEL